MGRAKETFGKKETRNNQIKKRQEKERRRQERKEQGKSSFEDMIAWVDENGQIVSEPPSTDSKEEVKIEDIAVSTPKGGVKPQQEVTEGKIQNFDPTKGYGFIHSNQLAQAIFFHVNDCLEEVKQGFKVKFDIEKGHKGLKAINIAKI